MTLLEKLKERFFKETVEVHECPPSLFARLRNIFFSAEFLANDLDRMPPECKCADAPAHLDGRCTSCLSAAAETEKDPAYVRKGCPAQIDELRVDIRNVRQALSQGWTTLQPEEQSVELKDELVHIEKLVEGLASLLEGLKSETSEFLATCSSEALQPLKQRSGELRGYATEFFWTVNRRERTTRTNEAAKSRGLQT